MQTLIPRLGLLVWAELATPASGKGVPSGRHV